MANKEIKDFDAVATPNAADRLVTQQAADDITRRMTVQQIVETVNPKTHASTHQNTGVDEINVAGLSGVLADAQTPIAHTLGGGFHNSDTLANLSAKISDGTVELASQAEAEAGAENTKRMTPLRTSQAIAALGSAVPAGAITAFAASGAPSGWLLCDGSAVSRTTFAALFAVIGTTYGVGNGSTTFNVPNLKGRIPVGLDAAQSEFDVLAETGGAKTHALTHAELASHKHRTTLLNIASGAGIAGTGGQFGTSGSATSTVSLNASATSESGGNHLTDFNESASGANGTGHNNLQPYITLNYIIKT